MPVDHYENFPVASWALPRHLREPIQIIYQFARSADDFADEGNLSAETRLALLTQYQTELSRIASAQTPELPLFRALEAVVRQYALPLNYFSDLLAAFTLDVSKHRYQDFNELLGYCRLSADPVGRLLLHLFDRASPENLRYSDAICSSLQIINFLQDVPIDYAKGRIYLPQDELAQYGIKEADIADGLVNAAWQKFYQFQLTRTANLLAAGSPLGKNLHGRIGLEIRLIIAAGELILKKLGSIRGDIFTQRPKLTRYDTPRLLFRTLTMVTFGDSPTILSK